MSVAKQIDAILPFIDRFEADSCSVGAWNNPAGQMPWFSFHVAVIEFQQSLYDYGLIRPSFDWPAWQKTAREYVEPPKKMTQPTH